MPPEVVRCILTHDRTDRLVGALRTLQVSSEGLRFSLKYESTSWLDIVIWPADLIQHRRWSAQLAAAMIVASRETRRQELAERLHCEYTELVLNEGLPKQSEEGRLVYTRERLYILYSIGCVDDIVARSRADARKKILHELLESEGRCDWYFKHKFCEDARYKAFINCGMQTLGLAKPNATEISSARDLIAFAIAEEELKAKKYNFTRLAEELQQRVMSEKVAAVTKYSVRDIQPLDFVRTRYENPDQSIEAIVSRTIWLDRATIRFRFFGPSSFNTASQLVLRPHFLVHFV
jgi:hypothetical protein